MEIIEEEHERYGICPYCGHKVYFDEINLMGVVECACGQWYNTAGQEVYSPEDWEEEMS